MKKTNIGKPFMALTLAWTLLILPLAAIAQTRVTMPKNRYSVQDDVKIGQQAIAEVERQMPVLNDGEATRYIQQVGERLVRAIPPQFQQPAFNYQFRIINARDINAFALPGGPMYVNRGMIEAARREGEMAGVMAHEISHVALRHGTAQATRQNNPLNQILGIGAILGGAVLGGQTGAQIGQMVTAGYFLRYSREYETQADILGAQIMANAGYDPRDLANMFQLIEQQSGGGNRAPEWLSSHPNPGNRYQNINREAQLLRVTNPIQNTAQFERIQSRLRGMPRAQSMAEIEQNVRNNPQGGQNPTAGGRYQSRVQFPSSQMRVFSSGNWIRMNVPNNWREFPSETSVWFAPEGAYGDQGITHGSLIGVQRSGGNLTQASQDYVNGVMQGNNYLRQQSNFSRASLGGRQALATVLAGRSPITGRTEVVTIYTTQLRSGDLFYFVAVAPENEASNYNNAFRNMINSIRLSD